MSSLQTIFYTVGILFFTVSMLFILLVLLFFVIFWKRAKESISKLSDAGWITEKILAIKSNPVPFLASAIALILSTLVRKKRKEA